MCSHLTKITTGSVSIQISTENPHVEAYRKGKVLGGKAAHAHGAAAGGGDNTTLLIKCWKKLQINPANLKRLNENFQRFGQTVEQMKDITDVTAATGAYSQSARETADALGQMKTTFLGATKTMGAFNAAAEDTAKFHQQVAVLSQNLGNLEPDI